MKSAASNSVGKLLTTFGLILVLFYGSNAAGQTENQLGARFKKIVVLEIRLGIDVFPTFTANGNVCQMVIEKREYFESRTSEFANTIPSALADQLVDELVPPRERGKPSKYLNGESYIAGGVSFIKQDYENVSVAMSGSSVEGKVTGARVIIINWPKRKCLPTR